MQDGQKAVWSIPYVSVAFFPSLKQNFIAYCASKMLSHPDCIFEIHQLWQSGFSRVYSNSCCSCSLVSHLIRYLAITYWNFKSLRQFKMPVQKSLETYWMHHIYVCLCVGTHTCMLFYGYMKLVLWYIWQRFWSSSEYQQLNWIEVLINLLYLPIFIALILFIYFWIYQLFAFRFTKNKNQNSDICSPVGWSCRI